MNKKGSSKKIRLLKKASVYILLIICSLIVLFPFYIMLITSFKTVAESSTVPITYWPENGFHLDGYLKILTLDSYGISFGRSFLNTLLYVIPPTVCGTFAAAMCGYAHAMVKFPGKKFLFSILLFSMMIPGTITMIPNFLVFETLGWVNTPLPLIVPGLFGSAGTVFFMRQYYKGLPYELVEAAKMDGLGHFAIFWKIMVPLSKPALVSFGLLGFIGGYNDYFSPMLYLYDAKKYTMQIALKFTNTTLASDNQMVMAACVLTMLPVLILYFFAQEQFTRGIAMSGLKA